MGLCHRPANAVGAYGRFVGTKLEYFDMEMDLKPWLQTSIWSCVLARLHSQDHPALVVAPSLTPWDNENFDCQYIGRMHKDRIGVALSLPTLSFISPPSATPLALVYCPPTMEKSPRSSLEKRSSFESDEKGDLNDVVGVAPSLVWT